MANIYLNNNSLAINAPNAVHKAIYLYRKPLIWFLFAGFALTFSIGFFTGQIKPLLAGFSGILAILLFVGQLKK